MQFKFMKANQITNLIGYPGIDSTCYVHEANFVIFSSYV